MNKLLTLVMMLCLSLTLKGQVKYYDAQKFPLFGKLGSENMQTYNRLPDHLQPVLRDRLWYLGTNTAGMYVRFCTDSKSIHAKWELISNTVLHHMPFIGIKGLDLYAHRDGKWQFVNSARPNGKQSSTCIIKNLTGQMQEYMLYLPLYDGVVDLHIGIDSCATIDVPVLNSPVAERPIVFYGTSITQGGCASRPGMAYTNILGRQLNTQVVNLGFSGNGQLDYEIADFMTTANPSVFVLDFLPNVNMEQINGRTENFMMRLVEAHPKVPILVVGNLIYPYSAFDQEIADLLMRKNDAASQICKQLRKSGFKNIHYVNPVELIGDDGEATVDGIHLTDLGFVRYAEHMKYVIRKYLN